MTEAMRIHDLDGSSDFKEFADRSAYAMNRLNVEIDRAAAQTSRIFSEEKRDFLIDTSFSVIGAYVGYVFGEAPLEGGLAGAAISHISRRVSNHFSTRSEDLASQIGHMRTRIAKQACIPAYRVPSYMI